MKFYQDNKTRKLTKYDSKNGMIELITSKGITVPPNDTAVISTGLRVKIEGYTTVPITVVPPLSIVRIFAEDNEELRLVVYNHSNGNIILEGGDSVATVTFVKNATLVRVNTVKDLME